MPPLHPDIPFGGGAIFSPPDHRDHHYIGVPSMAAANPNQDIRILATPVRSQEQTNMCTAFSMMAVRESLAARYHISQGDPADLEDLLSPEYQYYWARKIDGSFPNDQGCSMRGAAAAVAQYGAALEHTWPFAGAVLNGNPPKAATDTAKDYRISGYLRCSGSGMGLIDSIISSLADGYPVSIAFYVFPSLGGVQGDGRMPVKRAGEQPVGGHAVTVYGSWADSSFAGGGALLIKNSWGAWGEDGYGYMPWYYALDGTLVEGWTCR